MLSFRFGYKSLDLFSPVEVLELHLLTDVSKSSASKTAYLPFDA